MSEFENNAIFWIEVDKVHPNPYQPRREFNQEKLSELAESIRQYGVLQPITVSRVEQVKDDGGLLVEYELVAGERRHRASRMAGLSQIPAIIRSGRDSARMKLELAIIENLQREDLNPIDRARAFKQLADEFNFKHGEIGKKVGRSREYVSNSIRILTLPDEMLSAITDKKISEGHTRPLMMLNDRPDERETLFKEIIFKKLTVREAEQIARRIAQDKVRKIEKRVDPEILELEKELSESFGTRVQIQNKEVGGKVVIDFFSDDDLKNILLLIKDPTLAATAAFGGVAEVDDASEPEEAILPKITYVTYPFSTDISHYIEQMRNLAQESVQEEAPEEAVPVESVQAPVDEIVISPANTEEDQDDLYSIRNFSI